MRLSISEEWRKRWASSLTLGFLSVLAAVSIIAQIVEELHLTQIADKGWVKDIADLSLPSLIVAVFIFILVERFAEISPLRSKVEVILEKVSELRAPFQVKKYDTPEEAYSAILAILTRVEGQKQSKIKTLHHLILYTSLQRNSPGNGKSTEPDYFTRFKNRMKQCIESSGHARWDVKTFYNVTTAERLETIRERCGWGEEGYEVSAVCSSDRVSHFSPMIIDEEDTFLAFYGANNYTISSGIHIRNRDVASFFLEYFNEIWNLNAQALPDQPIFRLRDRNGIRSEELRRLEGQIPRREPHPATAPTAKDAPRRVSPKPGPPFS